MLDAIVRDLQYAVARGALTEANRLVVAGFNRLDRRLLRMEVTLHEWHVRLGAKSGQRATLCVSRQEGVQP